MRERDERSKSTGFNRGWPASCLYPLDPQVQPMSDTLSFGSLRCSLFIPHHGRKEGRHAVRGSRCGVFPSAISTALFTARKIAATGNWNCPYSLLTFLRGLHPEERGKILSVAGVLSLAGSKNEPGRYSTSRLKACGQGSTNAVRGVWYESTPELWPESKE